MRGQIAYEFLIMFFILSAGFTIWAVLSASYQEEASANQQANHLKDFGKMLQTELYTTMQMPEGFSRVLVLPGTIVGKTYNITIIEADQQYIALIRIPYQEQEVTIPPTRGTLLPGVNNLTRSATRIEVSGS